MPFTVHAQAVDVDLCTLMNAMQVVAAASAWCRNAQLVTATAVAAPPVTPAAAVAPEPGEQRQPRPPTLQGWGQLLREDSGASALGA